MPAAIPAIVAAASAYAAGTTILGLSILASAALIGVGTFALNTAGAALAGKPKQGSSAPLSSSQTIQTKDPILNRRFIYGERQVSGQVVYFGSTENNQKFHYVIVLATHKVKSIGTIWFNDEPIFESDINGSGQVISGKFANFARIKKYLGDDNQLADPDLVAEVSEISSTFRGRGCAYVYITLTKSTSLYANGEPNVSAWVVGKEVYDPRTASTTWQPNPALCLRDYMVNTRYGHSVPASKIPDAYVIAAANSCDEMVNTISVAQTVTSVSTATSSLTLNTDLSKFQTGDRVQVSSDGSLPSGISAATNYFVIVTQHAKTVMIKLATSYQNSLAGTAITISSVGTGTHTVTKNAEPRYTCNGMLNTGMTPKEIIDDLKQSMAGDMVPVGGQWIMKAGVYTAPTITFDENDFLGTFEVQTKHSGRERFNRVQGLYISPQNKGQTTDYPLVADSTFLTEDNNKPVTAQLDLPLTSRHQTAQRIARIQLNRHRRQRTAQFTTNMRGLLVQCTDTIMITKPNRSYSSKVFEVAEWALVVREVKGQPLIMVDMVAHESDSAIYDFNETTQEIAPQPVQAAAISDPDFVSPPGAPSLTSELYETNAGSGVKVRAIVTFAASVDRFVKFYEVSYKLTAASDYQQLPITTDTTVIIPDIAAGEYNVRVKALSIFNKESAYSSGIFTVIGLGDIPVDITYFAAISMADDVLLTWQQATDLDVRNSGFVQLRHTPNTSTPKWSDARDLDKLPGIATQATVPQLAGTYLAKFVDSSGIESENAAAFVLTKTQIFNMNQVAVANEHTTFTGTKTNMTVVSGTLQLTSSGGVQATSGSYDFNTKIDAGAVLKSYVTTNIDLLAYDGTNLFDSRAGNFDDSTGLFDGDEISGLSVRTFMRVTNDDPAGSPVWSDPFPFVAGYLTARGFWPQLIVTSQNSSYQVEIDTLSCVVDVPDVNETGSATTTSGALATKTFARTFTVAPKVVALILNAQAGDVLVVPQADITAGSFKHGVLNSGSYVVRTIMFYANGY